MDKFKLLHSVPQFKFPSDLRRWAALLLLRDME